MVFLNNKQQKGQPAILQSNDAMVPNKSIIPQILVINAPNIETLQELIAVVEKKSRGPSSYEILVPTHRTEYYICSS